MINIDLIVLINRPVEEVWTYLTDTSYATQWMTGLLEVGPTSEGPMDFGKKFRKVQRFFGWRTEMIYEITAYEPNRRLAYRTVSGVFSGLLSYEGSIAIKSIEIGTELSYTGQGELWGFFKLVEATFTRVAKRRFENDFNAVKELLEARIETGVRRDVLPPTKSALVDVRLITSQRASRPL